MPHHCKTFVPYVITRSVAIHYFPAEVTFLPLPHTVIAGTRFDDPGEIQGRVDLVGLVIY